MHKKIPNIFTFISEFKKDKILKLDKNIGIIYRNYGDEGNKSKILKIKHFCKINNRKFYLANNVKLALNLDLDGAYIPSFNNSKKHLSFSYKKNFILLGSAHNLKEIRNKELQKVNLIFISSIFKKNNNYLGINKFKLISNHTNKDIIALGGIDQKNEKKLNFLNIIGFAGINYFSKKKAP